MKQLVLLSLLSLLTSSGFAQATQRMPDACSLITAGDINRLFGTIVKYKDDAPPGQLACPLRSDDNAVEVTLQYQTLADIAKAEALLKLNADSLKLHLGNARPSEFTAITDFEPAGNGANYLVGSDAVRGPVVVLQFVIDKHLVTFSSTGVPVETVKENLPEIYQIIKRNSAL